jgi:ABC-type Mn2+/Zn2+ transport system ATPase subunit
VLTEERGLVTVDRGKVESGGMATPPALEIRGVTLSYNGRPVLERFSAMVPVGTRLAVVGPNGAGKSTLFKGLVGLVKVLEGQYLIDGKPAEQALAQVAYVPQREDIDWSFPVSVMDVVLMGRYGRLGWFRRPGKADREFALHILGHLGMAELANKPIGDLSGGQQQRAFLARALVQEPRVLVLDEPFAGVDAPTQEVTLQLLEDLDPREVTIIVSTHDLELAVSRFNRLMLLNQRLVAYGPPGEVLSSDALEEAFGAQYFTSGDGRRFLDLTGGQCRPGEPCHYGRTRRAG